MTALKRLWTLLAITSLLAGMLATSVAPALAVTHTTGLFGPHVGADSGSFKPGGDCPTLDEGTVLWHFVLPQTVLPLGAGVTGDLDVSFDSGALTISDWPYTKITGGVIHWDVLTTGGDHTLDSAWTDATSTAPPTPDFAIRLSHVCGGGAAAFDASIATEVHDPDHNDITNGSVVEGTDVHDFAQVTELAGNVASGTVYFSLFEGLECGENDSGDEIGTTEGVDLGTSNAGGTVTSLQAESTPVSLNAGFYSYSVYADVTSDSAEVVTVYADCEPFTVITSDISTDIHNAAHQSITVAVIGDTVHDTATVTFAPYAVLPANSSVTFYWFTNGGCTGDPNATSSPVDVSGQASGWVVENGLPKTLTASGSFAYQASLSSGDTTQVPDALSDCEPLQVFRAALTIGYWGTHLAPAGTPGCSTLPKTSSCNKSGPYTSQYLGTSICSGCVVGKLSTLYTVTTINQAAAVFIANNCSNASKSDSNAAACLAAQLLGAELNVANGANTCICNKIIEAKAFLSAVGYNGPGSKVTFTNTYTRAYAIQLKTALDNYNNNKGCPS
jgi:hypothetical protein